MAHATAVATILLSLATGAVTMRIHDQKRKAVVREADGNHMTPHMPPAGRPAPVAKIIHAALMQLQSQSHPSVGSDTAALLHAFQPCASCSHHKRYGEPHDGGYVMCEDDLQRGGISAAYSYGISGYDGWGNDVSRQLRIPVFEYDCTNAQKPEACATCDLRFFNQCLRENQSEERPGYFTLQQHLTANGHDSSAKGELLLKMDVEGPEWSVFAQEPAETLQKFREIVVEFHSLDRTSNHANYMRAMQRLQDAGFVVEHIHGNNNEGNADFGFFTIPNVLEVTFVQRSDSVKKCAPGMVSLPEDAVNNVNNPELEHARLEMLEQE